MMTADDFTRLAESEIGARYVYGAKQPAVDADPKAHGGAFDCSGLVTWAARRCGVADFPDGSAQQLTYCKAHTLTIDQAEHTRGALLFLGPGGSEHVVISRGDGTTIEARGSAYGVGEWSVFRDAWTAAALIPGLDYEGISPRLSLASVNRGYFLVSWTECPAATVYAVQVNGTVVEHTPSGHYWSGPLGRRHGRQVVRVLATNPAGLRLWSNPVVIPLP